MIVDHVSLYRTCTNVDVVYICTSCICTWVCNQFVHFVQYITILCTFKMKCAVNDVNDVKDVNDEHRSSFLYRSLFTLFTIPILHER